MPKATATLHIAFEKNSVFVFPSQINTAEESPAKPFKMCKNTEEDRLTTLSRQEKIHLLNERVAKITAKEIQRAEAEGKPLALEFVHSQMKMTTLKAGAPVYQLRSASLVYLYALGTGLLILKGVSMLHPITSLLCFAVVFVGYDFYSGVLHVVLDHPNNIALPVLGQPCLEFQWHHAIPDDIVRKDFVDVCGDLNVVVFILAVINLLILDLNSGVSMVIGGLKLWMAYYGQFSHKSAHSFGSARNTVSSWMQKSGLMISPKDHMAHHKPPHDLDFCLIGICNPFIDLLRSVTTNNIAWLSLFFVWSIFDLLGYAKIVESISSSMNIL